MDEYIGSERTFVERYRIEAKLGEGGMGAVYRAWDVRLDRRVAIKVLQALVEERQRGRFAREAKAIARLNHPNIVALYDSDEHEGVPFLVMEYVEGVTLAASRFETLAALLDAAIQTADALGYAHSQEVVHRDIKPENVLRTTRGSIKVLDFGLAIYEGAMKVTRTGMIAGTFPYLAPELIRGATPSPSSDQYALAIVLYEMLTGGFPFPVSNMEESFRHRLVYECVPLSHYRPDLPTALVGAIDRALAMSPTARYGSVDELRAVLVAVHASLTAAQADPSTTSDATPKVDHSATRVADSAALPAAPAAPSRSPASVTGPSTGSTVSASETTRTRGRWRAVVLGISAAGCVALIVTWWALRSPKPTTPLGTPTTPSQPKPMSPLGRPTPTAPSKTPTAPHPPHTLENAMRHLTEIRKRCLEAFEKNDCEGLKRLALQQVHLSAPGMQIALGYYESCSRQRAFTNASIAFKSGRCKEAVKYYRAGLPGQMRNKKVLSEYRENCRIYRREVLKRGSKP